MGKGKPKDESEVLKEGLRQMLAMENVSIHDYYGNNAKFGIVSDTHIGSLYENRGLLHLAYKVFKKEGIDTVYHCGDMTDGEKIYRGQEYELYAHGADAQVKEVVKKYPRFDGITTHFILFIINHHALFLHRITDCLSNFFCAHPLRNLAQ